MASQSKYYNTGGGSLKFTPIVNGILGSEEEFGQTENISFSTEVETLTHDNTETNVTYEDMNILKKVTGSMTIETLEISPAMLTRAFLGADNTAVVSADTTPDEITTVVLDQEYMISTKHLTSITSVTASTAGVLGVDDDYTLRVEGSTTYITFVGTGTATLGAGEAITFVVVNPEYSDISIEGFIDSKLEGVLTFTTDTANGVPYTYTFHRVSLLASGDYTLKSADDFAKLTFEGTMLASELVSGDGISKLFKIEGSELTGN